MSGHVVDGNEPDATMIVRELSAARNRCWPCTSERQRQAHVFFFFAQMLDVDFGV